MLFLNSYNTLSKCFRVWRNMKRIIPFLLLSLGIVSSFLITGCENKSSVEEGSLTAVDNSRDVTSTLMRLHLGFLQKKRIKRPDFRLFYTIWQSQFPSVLHYFTVSCLRHPKRYLTCSEQIREALKI